MKVHNSRSEATKLASLVGLSEVIRDHVVGWAMTNFGVVTFYDVGDKEMFDVQVAGSLSGAG